MVGVGVLLKETAAVVVVATFGDVDRGTQESKHVCTVVSCVLKSSETVPWVLRV